jgi:predicted lactoylglutathione lyase
VLVEDVDKIVGKIEKLGAKCFAKRPEGKRGFYETKFYGPDKVIFDIADHPWRGSAPLEAK